MTLSAPRPLLPSLLGWAVVDKIEGRASTYSTRMMKKLFHCQTGHAGTLDPLASGILPIALGQTTRLIPYLFQWPKSYSFTVSWGAETTTLDSLGSIVQRTNAPTPSASMITTVLPQLIGHHMQVPPSYSAAKIQGIPAYALARQGIDLSLPPRPVVIHSLVLATHSTEASQFHVDCSTGTYVRSLARDIAALLGTLGHITALRRTRVGPFDQGIPVCQWQESHDQQRLSWLRPADSVLGSMPRLSLTACQTKALWNGQYLDSALFSHTLSSVSPHSTVACYFNQDLIALGCYSLEWIKPIRCFIGNL